MLPINPILEEKLQIYRKVLVQEFIHEFNFLADVQAGRAEKKQTFTDQFVGLITGGITGALENVGIPGVNFLNQGIEIGIGWLVEKLKGTEEDNDHVNKQNSEIDQEQLRILLEEVALEASRRYEFVIDVYLSDDLIKSVVPLAKAQVKRILEYIIREKLPLNRENLLMGIIMGRSGAFVDGITNESLGVKTEEELELINDPKTYTIEGLCGRAAFMDENKTPYMLINKESRKVPKKLKESFGQKTLDNDIAAMFKIPKHKRICDEKNELEKDKKKQEKQRNAFKKFYNCGHTKVDEINENSQNEQSRNSQTSKLSTTYRDKLRPKYGYVTMPKAIIKEFDYEPQPKSTYSSRLMNQLDNYSPSIQVVSREQIKDYLANKTADKLFNDFIRKKYYPQSNFEMTLFEAKNEKELDFTGFDFNDADFSHCILNRIKMPTTITNTKFCGSHLIAADLTKVENAENADFSQAHLECINGERANLSGANFTHAHLHYAKLKKACLKNVKYLGALWIKADLEGIVTEDFGAIKNQQEKQGKALRKQQKEIKKIQAEMETQMETQNESMAEIQKAIKVLEETMEANKKTVEGQTNLQTEQTQQLHSLLDGLVQETDNRLVFERYCHTELVQLKTQISQTEEKTSYQDEHIQQLEKRLEKLERAHQEQNELLKIILNKITQKEEAETLFKKHCQTEFTQLKSDIQVNSESIQKRQQTIELEKQLQDQLRKLQPSQEEKNQMIHIAEKAKEMSSKIEKDQMEEKVFTEELEALTQSAQQYVEAQKEKLTDIHTNLQKLQTSTQELQQQIELAPSKSTDNNQILTQSVQGERMKQSISAKAPQAMFRTVKKHEMTKFNNQSVFEGLLKELKSALMYGNFEIQLAKKEIKIAYLSTRSAIDQASTDELEALQDFLSFIENPTLIQNSDVKENKLIIHTQFSDDVAELQEFLQKNGIISVEPKKSLELKEM